MENQNEGAPFSSAYSILDEWDSYLCSYADHETVYDTTDADERDQLHLILQEEY